MRFVGHEVGYSFVEKGSLVDNPCADGGIVRQEGFELKRVPRGSDILATTLESSAESKRVVRIIGETGFVQARPEFRISRV